MKFSVELIGAFSGLCTTISFLPQALRMIRTRSVKDISIVMYLILITGLVGWIIYGIAIRSYAVIISNFFTLILTSMILFLRIYWRHL